MRIELKKELPFIMKKGILKGNVEHVGGDTYVFHSLDGSFKQTLKKSEYERMLVASGTSGTSQAPPPTTSSKEEKTETIPTEEELKGMNKKELRKIAEGLYEGVSKKAKIKELISLILEAKDEENKEE